MCLQSLCSRASLFQHTTPKDTQLGLFPDVRRRGALFFGPGWRVTRNKLMFRDNLSQLLADAVPGDLCGLFGGPSCRLFLFSPLVRYLHPQGCYT
jgi:hypothetical protein